LIGVGVGADFGSGVTVMGGTAFRGGLSSLGFRHILLIEQRSDPKRRCNMLAPPQ